MRAELFCFIYLSTGKRSVNPRHQNNTELLLTIHLDYHRLFKADMTQEFRFFHRRLGVEEILIVDSVIHKGIDRKIATPNEVSSGRSEFPDSGLHDNWSVRPPLSHGRRRYAATSPECPAMCHCCPNVPDLQVHNSFLH